jgi:hypothetical protein
VSVCFRSDATTVANFASLSKTVKDTVENNWGRVANLQFEGWGICPGPAKNEPKETVVIHWRGQDPTDTGPGTGRSVIGFVPGASTSMYIDPLPASQFTALTLHEFGHALGFGHEQDHSGNTNFARPGCPGVSATGATVLTPFDTSSIMHSICGGFVLSPLDVVGVQHPSAYGRKPSGSVVGPNNRCLDIPGSSWELGLELQVYNCNGTRAQTWEWWKGKLRATLLPGSERCADAGDVVPSTPSILTSRPCYAGSPVPGQRFSFTNVEIRGIGEMCVVNGGTMSTGAVQIWSCSGGASQRWTIEPDGLVRAGTSGDCLDVPFSSFVPGRTLWLYPCNGTAAQRFTFTRLGELKVGGICVGSAGSLPSSGRPLQLETCTPDGAGKRNQQWHLRGPIRGNGDRCLDILGGAAVDRAKAQLVSCTTTPILTIGGSVTTSAARSWDFYF